MQSITSGWAEDGAPLPPRPANPDRPPGELPASVVAALWRGCEMGAPVISTCASGWSVLDAELPGGGWACHAIT